MGKDIRGHIDFHVMLMGEFNSLFHLLHGEILRFCPQAECFPADIHGVRAENYCGLEHLKAARGNQ